MNDFNNEPIEYFEYILEKYENSYIAEDTRQIIIGIDCEYITPKDKNLKEIYELVKNEKAISNFDGLFGVFAYKTIHYFEDIPKIEKEQYTFPDYLFAKASAYLYYDKSKKEYKYFGENKYINYIKNFKKITNNKIKACKYTVCTDIEKEKNDFLNNLKKVENYIKSGDVFQVVISSQHKINSTMDPLDFYKKLSKQNPSPYMYYFPSEYGIVIGASPEILVRIENDEITISPIAGTKPRGKTKNEDEKNANTLINDEKELAEHRMLIDLARNDIGKFSETGTVEVKNPIHIEYFEHVMHIASDVTGKKKNDVDIIDILSVVFPAGTLTGAPKIRAMEIIDELEEYKRHIYGGGIGFLHYNGNVQIAIIIRTAFYNNQNYYIQSGAGIVYDSDPETEYQEILHKRKSLIKIFEEECTEEKR